MHCAPLILIFVMTVYAQAVSQSFSFVNRHWFSSAADQYETGPALQFAAWQQPASALKRQRVGGKNIFKEFVAVQSYHRHSVRQMRLLQSSKAKTVQF